MPTPTEQKMLDELTTKLTEPIERAFAAASKEIAARDAHRLTAKDAVPESITKSMTSAERRELAAIRKRLSRAHLTGMAHVNFLNPEDDPVKSAVLEAAKQTNR